MSLEHDHGCPGPGSPALCHAAADQGILAPNPTMRMRYASHHVLAAERIPAAFKRCARDREAICVVAVWRDFHPATGHGATVPTSVTGTIAMAVAIHEVDS